MSALVPVERSPASVVEFLENAKALLGSALEMTATPAEILVVKTQIIMADTYAKELSLSKDIRTQAQEAVRRAEWSLEQAIKRGREAGAIKGQNSGGGTTVPGMRGALPRSEADRDDRPSAKDYFSNGAERSEVYQLGQANAEELDVALDAAKTEGNLSRANVVRKVKQQASPTTRTQRADLIEELAAQGYSSRQMPAKVGVTEQSVRQIARDHGIEIPADKAIGRTRRINSTQVVVQTASALEGLVMGVDLIDYDAVDRHEASQWVDSLSDSLRVLNRFCKRLKETTQ